MRSSVLVVCVATFVACCSSFISAETDTLDDNPYENTDVRRLRGEKEVQEERISFHFAKSGDDVAGNPFLKELKNMDDLKEAFSKKDRIKLEGKNGEKINMKAIFVDKDPIMMYKLAVLAIKGSKGKENLFKKTARYGLMAAGVVGLFYVFYCWVAKPPKPTPSPSAKGEKAGTTTPASD